MNKATKRVVFTSVQHAQTIHAKGYELNPLRTGYESMIAQRTSDVFANVGKSNGTVIKVTKQAITVKYEDGTSESHKLGPVFGSASGTYYPYELVTDLKKGDTFKAGETISYNKSFFKPDRFTPGQVNWKAGVIGRMAFMDNIDTLEDGSTISPRLAEKLETEVTEIRTITFRFDQVINGLLPIGTPTDLDTTLLVIQDPEVAAMSDDPGSATEALKRMSSHMPSANFVGKIAKIECFYHGDKEDMSDTVLNLVEYCDELRAKEARELNKPVITGEDFGSLRIDGNLLEPNYVALRVYIDRNLTCETGDKLVYFNQMKTVISNVMSGENYCEDGVPLDIQFAKNSVDARQVVSPMLNATTTMILRNLTEHVVKVYRGETDAKSRP